MKMSKLSNQTNSLDPQAVNSRVFVGNLNTFQCSKTDVERMFQKYGRLAGISMHKGYAFVQFTNPFDARNACHGEDGKTILSQILDVNMVAEPKPHQIGRKRQNVSKTGNDWDYYYDSYYTSTMFPATPPRPIKRQRLMTPQNRGNLVTNKLNVAQQQQQQQIILQTTTNSLLNGNCINNGTNVCDLNSIALYGNGQHQHSHQQHQIQMQQQQQQQQQIHHQHQLLGPFKVYSSPDTLICGNCRECFNELSELLDHKRSYCKLRFTCRCQEGNFTSSSSSNTSTLSKLPATKLLCALCKDSFTNPWDLMVHVQSAHMINIYELGNEISTNNGINCTIGNINLSGGNCMEHDNNGLNNNGCDDGNHKMMNGITDDEQPETDQLVEVPLSPANSMGKEMNGSIASSRDSTPEIQQSPEPACIMRTISIESPPPHNGTASLELGFALANAVPAVTMP